MSYFFAKFLSLVAQVAIKTTIYPMDLLPDTQNYRLRMRRECRERFPPPPISKETASKRSWHASRHVRDARAVMHVGIAYLRWREKTFPAFSAHAHPQYCVSGKRPIATYVRFANTTHGQSSDENIANAPVLKICSDNSIKLGDQI